LEQVVEQAIKKKQSDDLKLAKEIIGELKSAAKDLGFNAEWDQKKHK